MWGGAGTGRAWGALVLLPTWHPHGPHADAAWLQLCGGWWLAAMMRCCPARPPLPHAAGPAGYCTAFALGFFAKNAPCWSPSNTLDGVPCDCVAAMALAAGAALLARVDVSQLPVPDARTRLPVGGSAGGGGGGGEGGPGGGAGQEDKQVHGANGVAPVRAYATEEWLGARRAEEDGSGEAGSDAASTSSHAGAGGGRGGVGGTCVHWMPGAEPRAAGCS